MSDIRLIMIKISDSFSHVWDDLAEGLGVSLVVSDIDTPSVAAADVAAFVIAAGGTEREALDWLDRHEPPADVPRFVVGADTGRRCATQIVGRGATDYFALPDDIEILRNSLAAAVDRRRAHNRRASERRDHDKDGAFSGIVGESASLKEVLARAARVLPHADATILIVGETGTGKELLARAIHEGGPRKGSPFVAVNCSALPDHLIESELFGHERGAFTDARASKPGLFEVAEGGTLFLDEVGDLPVELQAKFLRVLQDKEVRRVGGTKSRKVDIRIIAATNSDLSRAMAQNTFRADMYFRLSVITLALPPLRERGDDVLRIAAALLEQLARHHRLEVPELTSDTRRALRKYHWPGNVRELRNSVERSLLLSTPGTLNSDELMPATESTQPAGSPIPFPAELADIATAAARATLRVTDGNRSEAARRLRISRGRLRRLLKGETMEAGISTTEEDYA